MDFSLDLNYRRSEMITVMAQDWTKSMQNMQYCVAMKKYKNIVL